MYTALDALTDNIAVLDETGTIVSTNAAWRDYARLHDGGTRCLDNNYLDVCDRCDLPEAVAAEEGIRAILRGDREWFEQEYLLEYPECTDWFTMSVRPFQIDDRRRLLVRHEKTTRHKALSRERARLHSIVNHSPAVAVEYAVEPEIRLTYISDNVAQFGYTRRELLMRRPAYSQVLHPDDLDRVLREIHQNVEAGLSEFVQTFRIRTAVGHIRLVEVHHRIRRRTGGAPVGQGILVDITDRQIAEKALIDAKRFSDQIIDGLHDGFLLMDGDGQILRANRAFCDLVGMPFETLLGQSPPYPFWPDDEQLDWRIRTLEEALAGDTTERERPILRSDGTTFHALISPSVIRDGNGEIRYLFATYKDITRRRMMEEDLRKLTRAIDQSPAMVVITDTDGNIEYVNPRFCEITGYSAEEVRGKNPSILKSGHTAPDHYADLWRTVSGGGEWRGEFINRRKDGSTLWESAIISPVKDGDGRITHYLAIKEDITATKRLEGALRAEEAFTNASLDQLEDMFVVLDTELRLIRWNRAAEMLTGYSRDDLYEQSPLLFVAEEHRERLREALARVAAGEHAVVEVDVDTADGKAIPFEFRGAPYFDEGNVFQAIVAVGRDIRERRDAERAIRASESKYRTLFEESRDAIYILSERFRRLDLNPAGRAMLGLDPGDRQPLAHGEGRYLPLSSSHLSALLEQLREKGSVKDQEMELATRDGRTITVLNTATGIIDDAGELVGVRGILRDITEQTRLQQQILETQKLEALGTLAGGIAHDFNNILAAQLGYAEMLQEDLAQNPPLRHLLDQMTRAGLRARDLVQQILTFSRNTEHQFRPVRMQLVVREALKLLRASLPASITLRKNLQADDAIVIADATQIHQVVMNLCTNAFHAMETDGGTLTVSLKELAPEERHPGGLPESASGYLVLTVEDTGHGMSPETLKQIYDPFFTTKPLGKGTGMGLAVVHGIVKSHHGVITVKSNPGEGTRFSVYLARNPDSDLVETAPSDTVPTGNRQHILLVDDEPQVLAVVEATLLRLNYQVTPTAGPSEALQALRSHPDRFDLVLSDYGMPGMNGHSLAAAIAALCPALPVVLMTGFHEGPDLPGGQQPSNIRTVIHKPMVRRDLGTTIHAVLNDAARDRGEQYSTGG